MGEAIVKQNNSRINNLIRLLPNYFILRDIATDIDYVIYYDNGELKLKELEE